MGFLTTHLPVEAADAAQEQDDDAGAELQMIRFDLSGRSNSAKRRTIEAIWVRILFVFWNGW